MKWTTLALLATAGLGLLALLAKLWRDEAEAARTDLVPRWKAFLETDDVIIDGERRAIPPARVPPVRPLAGVKEQPWKTLRFPQGRR